MLREHPKYICGHNLVRATVILESRLTRKSMLFLYVEGIHGMHPTICRGPPVMRLFVEALRLTHSPSHTPYP